jgi:AraC-like DNA-binding protein
MLEMASLKSQRDGNHVQLWAEQPKPVLAGRVFYEEFHNTLTLHCSDIELTQQVQSHAQFMPGIKLIIMLQGDIAMNTGDIIQGVYARQNGCFLLATQEPEPYSRAMLALGKQKQIVLSISSEWFEDGGYSQIPSFKTTEKFCQQHLAHHQWAANPRLQHLSNNLLMCMGKNDHLHKLQRESDALQLLMLGLEPIANQLPAQLDYRAEQRIHTLLEMLRSGEADQWSLRQMAQAVGSNTTTLQKQFQLKTGTSIFAYLRHYKLELARQQLLQGLNVTDAAMIAGYNNPANFATAFKRQFGQLPKDVRRFLSRQ